MTNPLKITEADREVAREVHQAGAYACSWETMNTAYQDNMALAAALARTRALAPPDHEPEVPPDVLAVRELVVAWYDDGYYAKNVRAGDCDGAPAFKRVLATYRELRAGKEAGPKLPTRERLVETIWGVLKTRGYHWMRDDLAGLLADAILTDAGR